MTETQTVEEAERRYSEASAELGDLIAQGASEKAINAARKRREQADRDRDEALLADRAQAEREAAEQAEKEEADRQAARQEVEQLTDRIEQLAGDIHKALMDAGRHASELGSSVRALSEAAKRSGLDARGLSSNQLVSALTGRVVDELALAGLTRPPEGEPPRGDLYAFVDNVKRLVGRDQPKEAA
jgi:hypothetical protein